MMANSDCELITSGLLDQPVNAISSLAFVAVAILLRERPVLAVLATAAGIGSFAYHGFGGDLSQWAHNLSIVCLIVGIAYERQVPVLLTTAALAGLAFWLLPSIAEVATTVAAVSAAVSLARNGALRSRQAIVALAVLGGAAIVNALSRTDQPWCDPNSLLQGHGVWHIGAAASLYLWGSHNSPGSSSGRRLKPPTRHS